MTSTTDIANLITANTELKDYYEGIRGDLETRIAAKEARVDTFIGAARAEFPIGSTYTKKP